MAMKITIGSLALWLGLIISQASSAVPDFKLMDVNPNSPRRNTVVSPRDYALQVSGYYFGMAH
jgi:hypothetical protein